MLADDLAELEKVFFGQLDRFLDSIEVLLSYRTARSRYTSKLEQLEVTIGSPQVRASWKDDQISPEQDGIVLRDGSVVTAKLAVCEIPTNWKAGNLSPLKLVVTLLNRLEEPWAYISDYSYSFYPNNNSEQARALGYFRYDFHPKVSGDGDIGGHPYFHLHHQFVDDEDESGEEVRFATGLVHLSDVLSICERNLFPRERRTRLINYLSAGKLDELALDLSADGFDALIRDKYTSRQWRSFSHRTRCENFLKKHGWKLPVLDVFQSHGSTKKR